jgi:hypothetical protein
VDRAVAVRAQKRRRGRRCAACRQRRRHACGLTAKSKVGDRIRAPQT